jgi:hypothetical protein
MVIRADDPSGLCWTAFNKIFEHKRNASRLSMGTLKASLSLAEQLWRFPCIRFMLLKRTLDWKIMTLGYLIFALRSLRRRDKPSWQK